ncbi:MAG: 5'-3' exonuclease H3TH domain-containing protein, partial [bacterium]|nr:5'-3' exonuclease H3TH domain-containing protein [bacterium]
NSIIHRAYHALPPLATKEGEIVNAVYGFLLVFFKAVKDFQPDFVVATFDSPGPTFRHKKYEEYKAKRPKAPDELYQQIPRVREVLTAFGIPFFEAPGFEADDIIGTIASLAPRKQAIPPLETIILSGDSDALQLVDSKTKVYLLKKGVKNIVLYDEDLTTEKFQGLSPEQILDYKALRGDASDNIPGVTGIGEKTAIKLLLEFGSLQCIYEEWPEEKTAKEKGFSPALRETLLKYKEQAFLSRELAEIDKSVPIDFSLNKCSFGDYDKEAVERILKKFNFFSLLERLPGVSQEKIGENLRLW